MLHLNDKIKYADPLLSLLSRARKECKSLLLRLKTKSIVQTDYLLTIVLITAVALVSYHSVEKSAEGGLSGLLLLLMLEMISSLCRLAFTSVEDRVVCLL